MEFVTITYMKKVNILSLNSGDRFSFTEDKLLGVWRYNFNDNGMLCIQACNHFVPYLELYYDSTADPDSNFVYLIDNEDE